MTARDELSDPLGWIIAGTAGGLGAVLTASLGAPAILVGLGIGAAVLGTKVALGESWGVWSEALTKGFRST